MTRQHMATWPIVEGKIKTFYFIVYRFSWHQTRTIIWILQAFSKSAFLYPTCETTWLKCLDVAKVRIQTGYIPMYCRSRSKAWTWTKSASNFELQMSANYTKSSDTRVLIFISLHKILKRRLFKFTDSLNLHKMCIHIWCQRTKTMLALDNEWQITEVPNKCQN